MTMKRNDVVEMMHSLNCLSYNQLCILADHEGISHGSHSKVELITIIIAHRAANPVKPCDEKSININRKKYYLESENNEFYLELTQEQVSFFKWCIENDINLDYAELRPLNPVKWEAP